MRILLLGLFFIISASSQAAEVLRCKDKTGHITLTNAPQCPDGTVMQSATPYVPERNTRSRTWVEEEAKQSEAFSRNRDDRHRWNYHYIDVQSGRQDQPWERECREAKRDVQRERSRTRKPTYDDLRRWNGMEFSACKGRTPTN